MKLTEAEEVKEFRTNNASKLAILEASKAFKSRIVVNKVSVHVKTGEIVGLLGPNGAGKTTSFNMMIGLEHCDSGSVMLDDKDVTRLPIYARARLGVGYLPQEPSVFRRLSVEDNIRAVLECKPTITRTQVNQQLEQLLETFGIAAIRKTLGMSLSGGERRRVEIARAFSLNPRFILLDEPFAGVDPLAVEDVANQIRFLQSQNIGILITDHNVRETLGICTRAYILNEGQIIVEGRPEEILDNEDARKFYLGQNFSL